MHVFVINNTNFGFSFPHIGPVSYHQTEEDVFHGGGWRCTQSKDEPTKRQKIQVLDVDFTDLIVVNWCAFLLLFICTVGRTINVMYKINTNNNRENISTQSCSVFPNPSFLDFLILHSQNCKGGRRCHPTCFEERGNFTN